MTSAQNTIDFPISGTGRLPDALQRCVDGTPWANVKTTHQPFEGKGFDLRSENLTRTGPMP